MTNATAKKIIIREGQFYQRRDGAIEGPLRHTGQAEFPFGVEGNGMLSWKASGHFIAEWSPQPFDLVRHVVWVAVPEDAESEIDGRGCLHTHMV